MTRMIAEPDLVEPDDRVYYLEHFEPLGDAAKSSLARLEGRRSS